MSKSSLGALPKLFQNDQLLTNFITAISFVKYTYMQGFSSINSIKGPIWATLGNLALFLTALFVLHAEKTEMNILCI